MLIALCDQIVSRSMSYIYKTTLLGQSGGKINYLLKYRKEVSILAMGNSRCAHHIIPSKLGDSSVYNLSHNGMSLIFQTGLIDQLINNEDIQIDTILLHLEMHEIFDQSNRRRSDIQFLKYYYNQNHWIRHKINSLSRFESIKYLPLSYKWNGKVMSVINNKIKSRYTQIPTDGYTAQTPTSRDSVNVVWSYNKRVKNTPMISDIRINENVKSYLEHIKILCDSKEVVLICFTSPKYRPSKENRIFAKSLNNYFGDMGITYFNYGNEFDYNVKLQSIWNWKDSEHLNEDGAIIFTEKIREDIEKSRLNTN